MWKLTETHRASMRRLRLKTYQQLEVRTRSTRGLSPTNMVVFGVIIATVTLAILETEPSVYRGRESLFQVAEAAAGVLFSIEYVIRVWISAENPRYGPGFRGAVKYMLSLTALIDLIAIISSFITPTGLRPFLLRSLRLARIIRLAKLGRMSSAGGYLIEALRARQYELVFSLVVGLAFMVFSATVLYLIEGPIQPDKFGSIPRAMWWATASLTTIGYGDVYPISPLGKIFACITAIGGIGLVAMPTGIMAAAFSEAIQKHSTDQPEPMEALVERNSSSDC